MILLTGGLGFIGTYTAAALLDFGEEVLVTSHRNTTVPALLRDRSGITVVNLDVGKSASWEALGEKHDIKGIVHLASGKMVAGQVALVAAAVAGMVNAVDSATRWGARLTIASTIGVYGGAPSDGLLREDAALNIAVPYGIPAAKKVMEILATAAAADRGLDLVTLRLPAVYGPLGNPTSRFFALPELVHAAAARRSADFPVPMLADDAIDVCYVGDVAHGIALAQTATSRAHALYNIGSGKGTSNRETAEAIEALRSTSDSISALTPGAVMPPSVLDVSRANRDFGFAAKVPLSEGLQIYLEWLESGNAR
jgi:UDP-glucose 4-epimerase